jgi:uncharacterized protein YbjT (DUF2867 family)
MIMVTGATGNIGRPRIDLLTNEGADIRADTRNPLGAGLPAHVEVVKGDPSRPDTIAPFLQGVTALFLPLTRRWDPRRRTAGACPGNGG